MSLLWGENSMIFTIGHSNRSWDEFLFILKHYDISFLVDIRRFPGSRLWPQFNKKIMEKELANNNIKYLHIEKLGGRRQEKRNDNNTFDSRKKTYNNYAWENKRFRSYADYMCSQQFREGIEELLSLKEQEEEKKYDINIAIMCAEALPWRCHRRLVSDYLLAIMNVEVYDIIDISHKSLHNLTLFACAKDGRITYPSKNK
jgi:uncharacterized protein (DUF488 family)